MKKNILLSLVIILSIQSKLLAQDRKEAIQARKLTIKEKKSDDSILNTERTFIFKVIAIEKTIENISLEEKKALKVEVESINDQLEKGLITPEKAADMKIKLAETSAQNIERKVAVANQDLKNLIQEKVDGKLKENDSIKGYYFSFPSMKIKEKSCLNKLGESRTTAQFVFAAGFNNLITNEQVAHSDFRYWDSHFYEWGLTCNTRILKEHNLLHAKYGISLMYNNLRPTENRTFVIDGNQTNLEVSPIHLEDSRFRNVYLVTPLHLEFDLSGTKSKNDKKYFVTHKTLRLGLGGYSGVRIKSKQLLFYTDADGNDVKNKTRGNFNSSDFIYGLSTYIGYKETSLYLKYDLNPMFKSNVIKQNNVSLGLRFDFN
jgi:hypothetical protein